MAYISSVEEIMISFYHIMYNLTSISHTNHDNYDKHNFKII